MRGRRAACAHDTPRPLAALVLLALAFAACGGGRAGGRDVPAPSTGASTPEAGAPVAAPGERLRVVATFSILGDLVAHVGGDGVELSTLVGPGGDAHTFEPSPRDSGRLLDADLVVENGLGFEGWLDDLYQSSGSEAQRIVATEGVRDLIQLEEHRGEYDPHVWHDVSNVQRMVGRIRDALCGADPSRAAQFRANAERYTAQLRELDGYAKAEAAKLPETRRKLVTTHDTFGYFARRYGFEIVDTALGVTTEESEPSARDIAELVRDIKAAQVPAVFAENVSNPGVMERVAREAGVELAPALYTDALGEPGGEGGTYREMVRHNVDTIVGALSR